MDKILVIDDSKITQMLVGEILAGKYELEFCNDGLSGISAAKNILPDLILLDIRLPSVGGLEVCKTLKGERNTRDIPIIFITSMDSELEKVRGFTAGAEDYLAKPFCLEELLARVKVHLASRWAKNQAVELAELKIFKKMAIALGQEINEPLTAIHGYLDIVQREAAMAAQPIKESLAGIGSELGKIRQISKKLTRTSLAANDNDTFDRPA